MRRLHFLALALTAMVALAGCAKVPTDPDERADFEAMNDPLEPMNRQIFDFNMALDRAIMKPVATFYVDNVPEGGRKSAHDFLNNLREPWIFANDVLQGHPHQAADSLGRFMVNSVWGLAGLFDVVASSGGPKYHGNDMGTTLAVWGLPDGPYLMLPFYGPSSPRDVAGKAAAWEIEPSDIVIAMYSTWAVDAHTASDMLDARAQELEPMNDIERNSIDFYAAVRSLYRQQRAAQAGQKPPEY